MSIPIVTIHLAAREHLEWVLAQAKHSNPHSDVFLIGDSSSSHYRFIEHEDINDYFQEAQEFKNIYRHFSKNSWSYELICFQRWFVLKSFMDTRKIEQCLCIDSDVMLYANIEAEQKKFAKFDFALYQKWQPHCVFINNLNVLKKFCAFLLGFYKSPSKLKELNLEIETKSDNQVINVCDMIFFKIFCNLNSEKIGDLSIIINDSVYDNNINISEGFEMSNGMKNIFLLENQPFCRNLILDKDIRFNALHFQGYSKRYIQEYFTGDISFKESINWGGEGGGEVRNLGKNYVALPLKLGEMNLIIFPDWSDLQHSLERELERVFRGVATHPDRSKITLLVNLGNTSYEDANIFLSGIILNLFMQEDLEVNEEPEISLVGTAGRNAVEIVVESCSSSNCPGERE
jgi:hypothetical protein